MFWGIKRPAWLDLVRAILPPGQERFYAPETWLTFVREESIWGIPATYLSSGSLLSRGSSKPGRMLIDRFLNVFVLRGSYRLAQWRGQPVFSAICRGQSCGRTAKRLRRLWMQHTGLTNTS